MRTNHLEHELFLLMINLSQLSEEARIVETFLSAMNSLWPGVEFRFHEPPVPADAGIISIRTRRSLFGGITILDPDGRLQRDAGALVRNAVGLLAIILENRRQANELGRERERLTSAVTEGTRELEEINAQLQMEIEERRQVEIQLRDARDLLAGAIENAPIGMLLVRPDGTFYRTNLAFCEMVGYSEDELRGRSFQEITHEQDRKIGQDMTRALLENRVPRLHFEKRYIRADGRIITCLVTSTLLRTEDDRPRFLFTQVQDITGRKATESALAREVTINADIARLTAELLSSTSDPDHVAGRILERARKLTDSAGGMVSSAGLGMGHRALSDGKPPGSEASGMTTVTSVRSNSPSPHPLAGPFPADGPASGENGESNGSPEAAAQDSGRELPDVQRFLSVPVILDGRPLARIILTDANRPYTPEDLALVERLSHLHALALQRKRFETERENLRLHLERIQRVEAIGALAGGIAHDFNNILFPIIGYAEMVLADYPESSSVYRSVDRILEAANRARELVRQILTFARQADTQPRPMKIQTLLREVLKLSRATLPSTIRIDTDIQADSGPVLADPTHVHQVAMNLITNAFHAMQDTGGVLSIGLHDVVLTREDLKDPSISPGPFVRLTVSDTGVGMNRTILSRIFDPYFTTKERDKGTGLGLSVVHGIVKSYGGHISVYSEPGKGSVFHVYLPRIMAGEAEEPSVKAAPLTGGGEHILVVDDEPQIAAMLTETLKRLGYRISTAAGAIEALDIFKANPGTIDMVITDLTMPVMPGDQLATALMALRPGLPVIVCTGFSHRLDETRARNMGIRGFITKPVIRADLARTIREALDTPAPPRK